MKPAGLTLTAILAAATASGTSGFNLATAPLNMIVPRGLASTAAQGSTVQSSVSNGIRELEAARQHAQDDVRPGTPGAAVPSGQHDLAPDDGGITAERSVPEIVAEDDEVRGPGSLILW